jgi:hypothetical protein
MIKRFAARYLGLILGVTFLMLFTLITFLHYHQSQQAFQYHILEKTQDILLKSTLSTEKLALIRGGSIVDIIVWDESNQRIASSNDTLATAVTISDEWRTNKWENVHDFTNASLWVKADARSRMYGIVVNPHKNGVSIAASVWVGITWAFWISLIIAGLFSWFVLSQRTKLKSKYAALLAYFSKQHEDLGNLYRHSETLNSSYDNHLQHMQNLNQEIEEINTLTRDNADKTIEANQISDEISTSTSMGTVTVHSLNESMENISASMEKTTTIIKAIDEIAFQTNILAVNASVEAARAGHAGAGFAVVADEVRRLAMKTTSAARETSEILDQAKTFVSDGQKVSEDVSAVFHEIDTKTVTVYKILSKLTSSVENQQQRMNEIKHKITLATQFGGESQQALTEINLILQEDLDQFENYYDLLEELNNEISISRDELNQIQSKLASQQVKVRNWAFERLDQLKSLTTKQKSDH